MKDDLGDYCTDLRPKNTNGRSTRAFSAMPGSLKKRKEEEARELEYNILESLAECNDRVDNA